VFSWSYGQLSPAAARAFRLLGLHPGPDISAPAVASVARLSRAQARTVIADLTRAHLLAEPRPGRYAFHDLLRAYAAEQAEARETPEDRHAALRRALDHYLTSAEAATTTRGALRMPVDPPPPAPGVLPEEFATQSAAIEWLTGECAVLLRIIDLAAEAGFDVHAWQLPRAVGNFFHWRGLWHDWDHTHRVAADAAARLGDARAEAITLVNWSRCNLELGQLTLAEQRMRRALDVFVQLGDRLGQGKTLLHVAAVEFKAGHYEEATQAAQQCYQTATETGDYSNQAGALECIGLCEVQRGRHRAATSLLIRAQQKYAELGNRTGQAEATRSLGLAYRGLGSYQQAIAAFQAAAELQSELGVQVNQA
jgi:tetratricopeptide (TPR) repeat protein